MNRIFVNWTLAATLAAAFAPAGAHAADLADIKTIVVIYAENRGFDHLYGTFPGADGLLNAQATSPERIQKDRDGAALTELPPSWGGLTAPGVTPAITQAQSAHLPNRPFALDDPAGFNASLAMTTRDLVHRFYQNQMQINGGANDRFAAWSDAGGLVMGYYGDGSKLPLWDWAKRYTLADNFYMAAFGGSFLNHHYLICSCAPHYPNAAETAAKKLIADVEADGVTLKAAPDSPASAMDGPPKLKDGAITPDDFHVVNTLQPPYQPSAVKPAAGQDPAYANAEAASVLPPQRRQTIGELLTDAGVSWAWYAGAWQEALDGPASSPTPNFQYHHQPFNYYAAYAPGTPARAEHLRDGGLFGAKLMEAIDAGALPQVSFYKPQGDLNEHPGYAEVISGDAHIADVLDHLKKSPQWPSMLVVVTYDENGGFWDHAAPPKGDRFGPGSRIPALIISPFAKKGFVDHTLYDTTSILRFLTTRFALPTLPGLKARDEAMKAHGGATLGDLTGALQF